MDGTARHVQPVLEPDDICQMQEVVKLVYLDDKVKNYISTWSRPPATRPSFELKDSCR